MALRFEDTSAKLLAAFGKGEPPVGNLFDDAADSAYFCELKPPVWWDMDIDTAIAYQYMTARAKFYYLPGMLLLTTKLQESIDPFYMLLKELSEPDQNSPEYRFELWNYILDMPKDQYCAVAGALPRLEFLTEGDAGSETRSELYRRRRARYWSLSKCE